MNTYTLHELSGNFSHELDTFDTFEEASDSMLELAGNDVTSEHGNDILDDDNEYMMALENALSYYNIIEG